MKKPNIVVKEVFPLNRDKGVNRVFVSRMDCFEIAEAYEDMIDALIEHHGYIKHLSKFTDDQNEAMILDDLLSRSEQALKKAGCTE